MRDIKFRAWSKMFERYYQDVQNVYDDDIGENFQYALDNKCLIVEQYTGLKDKNGVKFTRAILLNRQKKTLTLKMNIIKLYITKAVIIQRLI